MKNTINTIKILKKGVKDLNGNYFPCFYNKGDRTKWENGKHVGFYKAITIYAKSIIDGLPKELFPQNDSDSMTDYFETDKVSFAEGSEEYALIEQLVF